MKISYNWLSELASITVAPKELAEKLTMIGLEVDSVERIGDDHVLDVDVLSNRPDLLSHVGVAREAALVCGTALSISVPEVKEDNEQAHAIAQIEIDDPALCPRYTARVIRGVRVGPSPKWLVARLESIGQRSVNNVADITNYVMFEMGQPTHAFDLDKLGGKKIVVRRSRPGEQIKTLDGLDRELASDMLVIADAHRPVAVAGIMGGEDSEISGATKDVLLESAYFNPASVRRTARALGLDTEASYRFERGADYEAQVRAADRVAQLIAEIAGGRVLKGVIDVYPAPVTRDAVTVRISRIMQLTGLKELYISRVIQILKGLEFEVDRAEGQDGGPGNAPGDGPERGADALIAKPPSFRIDITREVDLVEEVARHVGYDLIALSLPAWSGAGAYLLGESGRRDVRRALSGLGFDEAMSFSFVNGDKDDLFQLDPPGAGAATAREVVSLINPIDVNESRMRSSLLPGLLQAIQTNFNQGQRDVRLFEFGRVFRAPAAGQRPTESESLGLALTGGSATTDWRHNRSLDFYDLKGFVEAAFEVLAVSGFTIERAHVEYLHPGQSALLLREGKELARFGKLHPRVASLYKFRQPVLIAEIDFEAALEFAGASARYSSLPRLPAVSRDIAFALPDNVSWWEIEAAVYELGFAEIASVRLFDVYAGEGIQAGTRSLAFRIIYRSPDRTMTDEEVDSINAKVRDTLRSRFGAELR
jgi:phenylalanyl-tRNA synthetase beta chain